jgi:hypothetical protein
MPFKSVPVVPIKKESQSENTVFKDATNTGSGGIQFMISTVKEYAILPISIFPCIIIEEWIIKMKW